MRSKCECPAEGHMVGCKQDLLTKVSNNIERKKKQKELWNLCETFIKENRIGCPETVGQCDWVIENAYDLIENICNIVGYDESDDET